MRRRCRLIITGRVQNMGLRAMVRARAKQHGLGGWVANEPNGTVGVEVEGEAADVALFIQWLWASPGFAKVSEVAVSELAPVGEHTMVIKR